MAGLVGQCAGTHVVGEWLRCGVNDCGNGDCSRNVVVDSVDENVEIGDFLVEGRWKLKGFDLNDNVDRNDEYILISIFVGAQSTRFRMYCGTRIPCATRFRNASIHRRPIKAPSQQGPYFQNFLTREFQHTST